MSVRSSRSAWASSEPASTFNSKANRATREGGRDRENWRHASKAIGWVWKRAWNSPAVSKPRRARTKEDHVYAARQPHSKVKHARLAPVFWLLASFYKKRSDFIFHSILAHNYHWILSRIWDVLKSWVHKIYSIFL